MLRIRYHALTIGRVSESSSVNYGTNLLAGRLSSDKRNEGLGPMRGDGNIADNGGSTVVTSREDPRTDGNPYKRG